VNQHVFEVDMVVFDKDGTLVDFDHLWGQKVRVAVSALAQELDLAAELSADLYAYLGYDAGRNLTAGGGPLAVASMAKLNTIVAAVLYRNGVAWERAESMVDRLFAPPMLAIPGPESVRAQGDVHGTMLRLTQAGVKIGVVTSDNRAGTLAGLSILGVADLVTIVVCGDDDLPDKPAPEAMWHIAAHVGCSPQRIMMVGDTTSDMRFGRNAGVCCNIGIRPGAGDAVALARLADLVVNSVEAITVVVAP
jgi:phosphoglycolate phosphatase-like HAD superfamily hydrolase